MLANIRATYLKTSPLVKDFELSCMEREKEEELLHVGIELEHSSYPGSKWTGHQNINR
jgi:hypothetical protein